MSIESVGRSTQNIDPLFVNWLVQWECCVCSIHMQYLHITCFDIHTIAHDTTLCNYSCIGKHILESLLSVRHYMANCMSRRRMYGSSCTVAITHTYICVECFRVSAEVDSGMRQNVVYSARMGIRRQRRWQPKGFPRKLCPTAISARPPTHTHTHIFNPRSRDPSHSMWLGATNLVHVAYRYRIIIQSKFMRSSRLLREQRHTYSHTHTHKQTHWVNYKWYAHTKPSIRLHWNLIRFQIDVSFYTPDTRNTRIQQQTSTWMGWRVGGAVGIGGHMTCASEFH